MPKLSTLAYLKKQLFEVTALHVTPRICANPSWTKAQRHTTKLHILRPQTFISHIPLLNFAGAALHVTPRICANLSWTYLTKIHHKTSNGKILISHIPVLNFAGTALHVTPRMWANPSCTNVPRHTINFRSEHFHLTHPCFELCRNNPEQITPRMRANPSWTNVPKTHHKTSDPKIFISHIPLLNFAGAALHITPGMCANPEPTFQRYTTKPQTVRFSSHTSPHVTPRMCANPSWTNVPRHTTNFRSDFFHLTRPCFELCRNRLHHACVPPWTNVPKIHHKTSDPKIFISHIPFLNFAGAARHVTPRMWANPSCTNVPRYTTAND